MDNDDLLDLFAGLAMQGYLAAGYDHHASALAEDSYSAAVAMIKEKEKRRERNRSKQSD